jgi:hypothetical protein
MAKEIITVETVVPPKVFRGRLIEYPQYQADIIRLEKLIERGGVYLDIDNMSLKSFKQFRKNGKLLMGASPKEGVTKTTGIADAEIISNSIIITYPDHPFLKHWYRVLDQYITKDAKWAYHAVCLPKDILAENPEYHDSVTLMDWYTNFCHFDWQVDPFIFDDNKVDRIDEINEVYTIVFYQTMVYDVYLKYINITYFQTHDNIFTRLFNYCINFAADKKELLMRIITRSYNGGNWSTLEEWSTLYLYCYDADDQHIQFMLLYAVYQLGNNDKVVELTKRFDANPNVKTFASMIT